MRVKFSNTPCEKKMTLPWFRFYHRFITDPDVEELSFEDQRHFVFILCLKASGLLDKEYASEEKRERMIARRLGLQDEAFTFAKERLIESSLIDENWQPRSWEKLQFKSDSSAERMRRHRAKKKEKEGKPSPLRHSDAVEQNRTEQNRVERRASRFAPKDFKPTESTTEWATEQGFTEVEIRQEVEAFKDYEYPKPKKDFQRAFRNWLRKAKQFSKEEKIAESDYAAEVGITRANGESDEHWQKRLSDALVQKQYGLQVDTGT